MTLASLLERCDRAGVRLEWSDGRVRYRAAGGIDPALKAELQTHKDDLARHLGPPDPVAARLAEMVGVPRLRARVHPEWFALPAGILDDVPDPRFPRPDLPTTIIVLVGAEREVRHLPAGHPVPPDAVLWSQPGGLSAWNPGPAHALKVR